MSIAWGSLVLLIVLLPGVLFFIGIYWPEQFTREAQPRSPLGQLAGSLLVAFLVHGLAYSVLSGLCAGRFPCVSTSALLEAITIDATTHDALARTASMLHSYRWWIFAYVMGSSAGGIALGGLWGWLIATRRIRGFSRHGWIYDLSVDGLTYAYVLSTVAHDDKILMYKGFVRAFGLQQDGKFSYLVLSDVTRLYLRLSDEGSLTSEEAHQRVIGASSSGAVIAPTESTRPKRRVQTLFVIEGADIANVVFDRLATDAEAVSISDLRKLLAEESASLGSKLSEAEIDEILGTTEL